MVSIEWSTRAFRQLRKIKSLKEQRTIYDATSELKSWPDCRGVKKLKNYKYQYRLMVGKKQWRVLFDVSDNLRIIWIQEVKKRDDRTYKH